MSDHRRLQRSLFRMQLDSGLARALRAREPAALASTGLDSADLELLVQADPAGVSADPGGRRRSQFLGNLASEFLLTTWTAVQAEVDPELLESFTASAEFHEAAASNGRFPLAFAAHARRRAAKAADSGLSAFVELEAAMAEARRSPMTRPSPRPGQWSLSPSAHLLELPAGTCTAAASLREALDGDRRPERVEPCEGQGETVLVLALPLPGALGMREVVVEPLSELPAALLRLAAEGLDASARARFCSGHEVSAPELEDFADSLVEEGVLLRG